MARDVVSSSHLSSNRVRGDLGSTTPADVLDGCRARRVTGEVVFHAGDRIARIELHTGSVERAELDGLTGDDALAALASLTEGTFEVVQRLPGLEGSLGSAAEFQGDLTRTPLIQIMRHIESHALTVTVTVVHEWDRGTITYRDGDLEEVDLNGDRDPDHIGALLRFPGGKFRVLAGTLELPVPARRVTRRARTEPFHVGHVADLRRTERRGERPGERPTERAPERPIERPAPPAAAAPATPALRTGLDRLMITGLRVLVTRARRITDRLEARLAPSRPR